ncbi:MAG: hypothetical protein E6G96_20850, partial [Alphaproteobacteria bacterium]
SASIHHIERSVRTKVNWQPATRYDKLVANYVAFIQLASIRLWLRVNESTPWLNRSADGGGWLSDARPGGGASCGYHRCRSP